MRRVARRRAAALLDANIEAFRALGYGDAARPGPLEARLAGRFPPLALRMAPQGRAFGGSYALEISTAEPVLPPTRGVVVRGRGLVRLSGLSARARSADPAGAELARRLESDRRIADALAEVHFERIRIEPDGRPVIRHMGGSVVWMLIPPLVRPVPLVPEQAEATVNALRALAVLS